MKNYVKRALESLNCNSQTIDVKLSDYQGNKTKFLGLNDIESIQELIDFLEKRKSIFKIKGLNNMKKELLTDDLGFNGYELRLLPVGGDSNVLVSKSGYRKEMSFRRELINHGRTFDFPSWDSLKRYEVA